MNFWRWRKGEPLSGDEIAAKRAEDAHRAAERAQRAKERVEQKIAELEQAVHDENDQSGSGGPDDSAGAVRVP